MVLNSVDYVTNHNARTLPHDAWAVCQDIRNASRL
jgi:hypothetical protein